MSAATGNTYAEKWTLERTLATLESIDRLSRDANMMFIGQAMEAVGTHQDVWRYWRRKWRRRYEIIDLMKTILQRFENRIFERMTKKEMPERVGMFALRHHYGWCEGTKDLAPEDESYIDQEPVPAPEPAADPTPATTEHDPSPATAERQRLTPRRVSDENAAALRQTYNQRYPDAPVSDALPFYIGVPPAGAQVVRFGDGYFLKE